MVKSIILNLKNPNQQPTLNNNKQSLAQSQQQQQQQQSQQPDLNFLLALSLVCMKRSDLFLKQPTLVDVTFLNLKSKKLIFNSFLFLVYLYKFTIYKQTESRQAKQHKQQCSQI